MSKQEKEYKSGVVFDIQEFAVKDGPGLRTTVFMKGCPLRCRWCHNPEGLSPEPQVMLSSAGDRIVGKRYTSRELADLLNKQADILRSNEGGVTFSGGEPLMQAEFVAEVIDMLDDVHTVLDTSGYSSESAFRLVAEKVGLVLFDLKIISAEGHKEHTGVDNGPILRNLKILSGMGKPFVLRVPMVPGLTDTDENLSAIAELAKGLSGLVRVDLLTYNPAAGGKYRSVGMEFAPDYDEKQPVNMNSEIFSRAGVVVSVVK